MGSSAKPARDEWLFATLEGLLSREQLEQLKAKPVESLWDEVLRLRFVTEQAVIDAVAAWRTSGSPPAAGTPVACKC